MLLEGDSDKKYPLTSEKKNSLHISLWCKFFPSPKGYTRSLMLYQNANLLFIFNASACDNNYPLNYAFIATHASIKIVLLICREVVANEHLFGNKMKKTK